MGEISWILSMHVTHNRKTSLVFLSQEKFIEDILQHFGKSDIRPMPTPALANEQLNKLKTSEIEVKEYQQAIGTLMYPMLGTRPDLAFTVALLGRHTATPGEQHQCALDRVFRYLHGTSNWRLAFQQGKGNGLTLHGYADAN